MTNDDWKDMASLVCRFDWILMELGLGTIDDRKNSYEELCKYIPKGEL